MTNSKNKYINNEIKILIAQFAWATTNHFLRKNLRNRLRSGTMVATVACLVSKCDRFFPGNYTVWNLDLSGEFHWQLDYTPCCESIHKDIALFLANPLVSCNAGTSRFNRHTHDLTVEDRKQELAIFSITVIVQRLDASFAFA